MRAKSANPFICCLAWWMLLSVASLHAENDDGLDRKIQLPKATGTIYELLEKVTNRSGYLFIYDNQAISNEQSARIRKGEYTIRQAIYEITGNPQLQLRLIGKHILIQLPSEQFAPISYNSAPDSLFFTVEGALLDAYTREPVPYATIGIPTDAIGTVSNQNGDFRLRLPDSLRRSVVRISHLGYETKELPVSTLAEPSQLIILEPKVISIQEIVVRLVNPMRLLHNMLDKREQNYSTKPVYFTSFYREGVERKKGFVNLTEAVFKIYKTPYNFPEAGDQVKLLKMRRISNENERDTLITKMKSGINASLMLDVIKNLPDFLLTEEEAQYNFLHSDITVIDDRLTNVVSFEQKKDIKEPLYKGELYIDAENDALLSTRFEINPRYVEKATDMLVTHKSKNLRITTQQVVYTVSYKPWNGKYYVNNIRGDLYFKVRKANQLFGSSSSLHTWFEMATCKIETQDVTRFTRNETLQTRTIFAETSFAYDNLFWENFNIILPEEQLNDAINKITSKIEETGGLP